MGIRGKLFFYLTVFSVALFPTPAGAILGDSESAFGLDGSLRTIGAVTDNYNFEPFFEDDNTGFSQSILRLTAGGYPQDWLCYELHAVQSLDFTTTDKQNASERTTFNLVSGQSRYRAIDASWNWVEEDDVTSTLWLDRFNTKFSLPWADLTIGRQAITFGKAYFWNPLDIFLPFDLRQFDRDYKPGVDAARVDIPLGDFSGINLVGALGREINASGTFVGGEKDFDASWYGSAVLTRMFTNQYGWDLALQGGKVYGGYQVGGVVVGEVGSVEVRGEAAYLFADKSQPLPPPYSGDLVEHHLTAVFGLGHRFENALIVEAEYLFNGAGDPNNLDASLIRFNNGASLHLSRHVVGLTASYEFYPILTGQLAWLFALAESSSQQIQPGLTCSLADEVDLLLGASINIGARPEGDSALSPDLQSEFGTYPDIYYLELKVYF